MNLTLHTFPVTSDLVRLPKGSYPIEYNNGIDGCSPQILVMTTDETETYILYVKAITYGGSIDSSFSFLNRCSSFIETTFVFWKILNDARSSS